MNNYFIYVFNEEDRDTLLSRGCLLVKRDDKNMIYVFENPKTLLFAEDIKAIVYADTLTF